jgi:8-oxo-dGTP pyrophosphatase MutT (NUDIX family)
MNTYKGDHKKGEIEIKKENLVFENKFARLYNDDVIFPEGSLGKYLRFEWTQKYGVMIFPKNKNGEILLIKNFRHEKRGWSWEIPKGFGEEGMEPLDCAKKELLEETGYTSNDWRLFKEIKDMSSTVYIYEAILNDELNSQCIEAGEAISEVRFFKTSELEGLLKNDMVNDSITIAFIIKEMKNILN